MNNGSKKILIVDDDEAARAIIRNIFEKEYTILEAVNGKEALEQLEENGTSILLVVLDLIMPKIDGYEVLKQMEQTEAYKEIPIVVFTGETTEKSDIHVLSMGVFSVVHKPFKTKIIKEQLKQILKKREQELTRSEVNRRQKYMIARKKKIFFCTYFFDTGDYRIDPVYKEMVSGDFVDIFKTYPFQIDNIVLPAEKDAMSSFLTYQEGEVCFREIKIRLKTEEAIYEWFRLSAFFSVDNDNHLQNLILMVYNNQEEEEAKNRKIFFSNNDVLTHIPNKDVFNRKVEELVKGYPEELFAVVTMDIGQFRMVNSLFGYAEGDKILKYIAIKLQETIENLDKGIYCRASSDIFKACVPYDKGEIREMLRSLQESLNSYPIHFELELFAGVYLIEDRTEAIEKVVNHAIYARNVAKKMFHKPVVFYDDTLRKRESFEETVAKDIDRAFEENQFEIYMQPKMNAHSEALIGAEALIRWKHPEKGYISPAIFIPIIEGRGTVSQVDLYVLDGVCRYIKQWMEEGIEPVPVSVNISRADLYHPDMIANIVKMVDSYEIPRKYVEFEITESAFVQDYKKIIEFTEYMRKAGYRILIDDFGSEYSSLNLLKDVMVDVLKIDIRFLPADSANKRAAIILKSVIDMARNLGLRSVAEGVETEEQKSLIKELGCDEIQGYYYYRPIPERDFHELLKER